MLTLEWSVSYWRWSHILGFTSVSYIPLSVCQEKHTLSLELRLKLCIAMLQWKISEITTTVETILFFPNPTCPLFCDMQAIYGQCVPSLFHHFFCSSSCISVAFTILVLSVGEPEHYHAFSIMPTRRIQIPSYASSNPA